MRWVHKRTCVVCLPLVELQVSLFDWVVQLNRWPGWTTWTRGDLIGLYLTARGPRVQAWFGLHNSRRQRQLYAPLQIIHSCLRRCAGWGWSHCQPSSSNTTQGAVVTHAFTPLAHRPKEAGQCQCNETACEDLLGTPLRPCMGLRRTLRVFMYVVVETHFRDNIVRFKRHSNDERWTSDSISSTPTFPSSLPL